MYDQPSQPSLTNLFGTVIVFMIVVAYGFVSLNTEDVLWFWPKFEETPQEIVVFCYGNEKVIEPGSSQFTELTALANESISGRTGEDFTAGSLHIQNIRAIRDFLSSQGICTAQ